MGAKPKWSHTVTSYSPLSYHKEIPSFNNVKTYDLLLNLDDKQDSKIDEDMLNNKPFLLEELSVMTASLDKVEKKEVDDRCRDHSYPIKIALKYI